MKSTRSLWAILAVLAPPVAGAVEYRTVLPQHSAISFEFRQMGVPVEGSFKRFTTQIVFDPAKLEAAHARIEIDLASINAGSPEADEESAGQLWFNRSAYPKATFVSGPIRSLGNNRYEMRGRLTLKGRTRDMAVPVTFNPGKTAATFDGVFTLKRLDFGIGEGLWANVDTVANDVKIRFHIAATGK